MVLLYSLEAWESITNYCTVRSPVVYKPVLDSSFNNNLCFASFTRTTTTKPSKPISFTRTRFVPHKIYTTDVCSSTEFNRLWALRIAELTPFVVAVSHIFGLPGFPLLMAP